MGHMRLRFIAPNSRPLSCRRLTLTAFSAKMHVETNLEELSEDLVAVVHETMQPAHVTLWLRQRQNHHDDQFDHASGYAAL